MNRLFEYFKKCIDFLFGTAKQVLTELLMKFGNEQETDAVFKQLKKNCHRYILKAGMEFVNTRVTQTPKSWWQRVKDKLSGKPKPKPKPLDLFLGNILHFTEVAMNAQAKPI